MTRREALKHTALLLGAALSRSTLVCAQTPGAHAPDARPRSLSVPHFAAIAALAECLLPRTDTPGASDAGVPAFVDTFYGGFMTSAEKNLFVGGLDRLDDASRSGHGRDYAVLPSSAQADLLRALALPTATENDRAFLRLARGLVLSGYFTSERVGTDVLNYDPVPGVWESCIPVERVHNTAWTEG